MGNTAGRWFGKNSTPQEAARHRDNRGARIDKARRQVQQQQRQLNETRVVVADRADRGR
jgi:hypothetical protein